MLIMLIGKQVAVLLNVTNKAPYLSLLCSKFGPFDYAGSWEEVKKVEQVHSYEAEQECKEESVDAGGGPDDDIHGGTGGDPLKSILSHWNNWQKLPKIVPMQFNSINSEPHFLAGAVAGKRN